MAGLRPVPRPSCQGSPLLQTQKWGIKIFAYNISLPGRRTTTLARHLSAAGDLRMEEEVIIAVDNSPILFKQSLYTYRDHTLLATKGSILHLARF